MLAFLLACMIFEPPNRSPFRRPVFLYASRKFAPLFKEVLKAAEANCGGLSSKEGGVRILRNTIANELSVAARMQRMEIRLRGFSAIFLPVIVGLSVVLALLVIYKSATLL